VNLNQQIVMVNIGPSQRVVVSHMTHLFCALPQIAQEPPLNLDAVRKQQQPIQTVLRTVLIAFALWKDSYIGSHQDRVAYRRKVNHFHIIRVRLQTAVQNCLGYTLAKFWLESQDRMIEQKEMVSLGQNAHPMMGL
jgi:hypothetical protein